MESIITFTELYTEVHFRGQINWENYVMDNTTNRAVEKLFEELRPDFNIWLDLPRDDHWLAKNKIDQHKELRSYIEERLGHDAIKGKMRIWDREGSSFRVWCKDLKTFMQIRKLFKDDV
jgi:hypothetical protein